MKNITFAFLLFGAIFGTPFLSSSQNIDKNGSLEILKYPQSLAELFANFKGNVVYIDVMASWCKPCIAEFRELKKNRAYFDENNIVKLYVTIDSKEDIDKAFSLIERDSLNGYFISFHPKDTVVSNSTFRGDFEALFLKDERGDLDISLPRYAIVNRNGEVVERRAERPSNFDSLKKQLEKYLR